MPCSVCAKLDVLTVTYEGCSFQVQAGLAERPKVGIRQVAVEGLTLQTMRL